jgi:hypothetical protein
MNEQLIRARATKFGRTKVAQRGAKRSIGIKQLASCELREMAETPPLQR